MFKKLLTQPFSIALICVLTVLGVLRIGLPGVATAQEPDRDPNAVQGAVGSGFTYQGYLKNTSGPVNGVCDFRFTLYDDALLSPVQVGGPLDKTNVSVSGGYFSTSLDFGRDVFTGEDRQMGIAVRCPAGSGSYTTLSGMVGLDAAPYAVSLMPGAVISGSVMAGAAVKAENTYDGMFASYGVQGVSRDVGVYGESPDGIGVRGSSAATRGYGVYGESTSVGTAMDVLAYGGYFVSNGRYHAGVYGENKYGNSGTLGGGYGVYGKSIANGSYGVYGENTTEYGFGVYSEGDAHINGKLTWKAITGTISIPPAAFTPSTEGYNFTNDGHTLTIGTATPNSQYWLAPVQLPQGAIVTKFTFYWTNHSASVNGSAILRRSNLAGTEVDMAEASTEVSTGPTFSSDNTVSYYTVDNTQYNYYIWLHLRQEGGAIDVYGMTIEYTITTPY